MSEAANNKVAIRLGALVLGMCALSFAAVPFYSWFCSVTGFGGETTRSASGSDTILDREIIIRFDATLASDMPWEFKPKVRQMKMRIGETGLAFYEAYNPTDKPIAGAASYNVAPFSAGGYFTKIDCFCFTEQVLQPGERVDMPVTFYVDPEIVNDAEAGRLPSITLSYTFHLTDLPEEVTLLQTESEDQLN